MSNDNSNEGNEEKGKIKKIKNHIRENRKLYIAGSAGIALGAMGMFAYQARNNLNTGNQLAQKITQIGFRNEATTVAIQLIERSTPSKPVHLVGTERYFDSINDAARKTGYTATQISKNAHNLIPDLNGDVFEFVTKIAE